jgi:hypothetical protein
LILKKDKFCIDVAVQTGAAPKCMGDFEEAAIRLRLPSAGSATTSRMHPDANLDHSVIEMEQLHSPSSTEYTEQRECLRLKHESFVIVLDCNTGKSHLGKLYNYNRMGGYFELDTALDPGSDLKILIEESPYITTPIPINATVVWCRDNDGSAVLFRYGTGVKYNQEVNC